MRKKKMGSDFLSYWKILNVQYVLYVCEKTTQSLSVVSSITESQLNSVALCRDGNSPRC